MTLLNTADRIYLGSTLTAKAYVGRERVWPYQNYKWKLITSLTVSTPVPNIVIKDLTTYTEIRVLFRNSTVSISGTRRLQVSMDNGTTFLSTMGQYLAVETNGNATPNNSVFITWTAAANQCSGDVLLTGWNLNTNIKVAQNTTVNTTRAFFIPVAGKPNAIKIDDNGGGNITGGKLWIWGR